MLFSQNPFDLSYFFPIIFIILLIILIFEMALFFIKKNRTQEEFNEDKTLFDNVSYSFTLGERKDNLYFRYMCGYICARASMWAKSPYMYMLYSTLHGFSVGEIGVLYAIDATSALIFGPIIGSMADIYGRKKFAILYNTLVIINLSLRITGIRALAYVAQVLTGMGASIVNTSYEAWIVFESNKEFGKFSTEKDKFLKKLFKSQNIIDSSVSIIITGICAISFYYIGIIAPIIISMTLCLTSSLIVFFTWDENKPASDEKSNFKELYKDALKELKKREILTVGIIESLIQAVLNVFIFAWTPLLQMTVENGSFNPGMAFINFVLLIILGAKLYEIVIINFKCNLYLSVSICIIFQIFLFGFIYFENSFFIRFICCALINGSCGFYQPANSIIKAKILPEKFRTTLMSMFRIPLNIYVIVVLLYIKSMNPLNICILCMGMLLLAFISAFSLFVFPVDNIYKAVEHDEFTPLNTFAEMTQDPFTFERGESFLVGIDSKYDTKKQGPKSIYR